MIKLEVEDYCQNCDEFEPDVRKDQFFAGGDVYCTETTVRCEHRMRCATLVKYFKEAAKKQNEVS